MKRWFTSDFHEKSPETVGWALRMLRGNPPEGYASCCEAIRDMDLTKILGDIYAAKLIIAGAQDEATPPGSREKRVSSPNYERGIRVRREVLGNEHVDATIERTTGFTADFQVLITRYAWGEIWDRPGLKRKTRSCCITLTALVALGHLDELALHICAALRNGLTEEEIKEVLLQSAIYCEVPAANSAFAVAQRVLADLDMLPETRQDEPQ